MTVSTGSPGKPGCTHHEFRAPFRTQTPGCLSTPPMSPGPRGAEGVEPSGGTQTAVPEAPQPCWHGKNRSLVGGGGWQAQQQREPSSKCAVWSPSGFYPWLVPDPPARVCGAGWGWGFVGQGSPGGGKRTVYPCLCDLRVGTSPQHGRQGPPPGILQETDLSLDGSLASLFGNARLASFCMVAEGGGAKCLNVDLMPQAPSSGQRGPAQPQLASPKWNLAKFLQSTFLVQKFKKKIFFKRKQFFSSG